MKIITKIDRKNTFLLKYKLLRGEPMEPLLNNQEARTFICKMMQGYQKRKEENRLYSEDDFIPEHIITTYYEYVTKPEFHIIIDEYKKQFIFNEARVEKNTTKEEQAGLGKIYDYIQNFDFNKDYFNVFTTSLILHQKLYSCCPNPEFGGTLRDTDVILQDLPVEVPTAKKAKEEFNAYIATSNEIFAPLERDDIFTYINRSIKLTTDLIYLQPFPDGNKRTFRALQNLLFKRIALPPIYIETRERKVYKEHLVEALQEKDYSNITRFYYYKICDAIMNLDINRSEITETSQQKILLKK